MDQTPQPAAPLAAAAVTVGDKTFDTLWGLVSRRVRINRQVEHATHQHRGPCLATVVTVNGALLVLRLDDPGSRRLERVSVDLVQEVLDRASGTD